MTNETPPCESQQNDSNHSWLRDRTKKQRFFNQFAEREGLERIHPPLLSALAMMPIERIEPFGVKINTKHTISA
jgi:hypothetical protein